MARGPFAPLALFALAACAPMTGAPARASHVGATPAARDAASPVAQRPRPDLPRVEGLACPIAFDDADVVLARVGDVTLTACDVAVAAARNIREGRPALPPREILRELVADAMLADEARARGLERDPSVARRVRETLAAGVVRAEALAAARDALPSEEDVARYYEAHRADFTISERVHLREVVLADEARARATLRDAAIVPFETLVAERSTAPEARRDQGDLGLVPREGNDRVPRAVAEAGFALAEPGAVHPEPIRVETTEYVGRRRRPRTRVSWHVVQLLARVPERTLPLEDVARIIRHRLAHRSYEAAREAVRARLLTEARTAHPPTIHEPALRRTRVQ
jgi:hypothetical protein